MDEQTAFERQVAAELERRAGPALPVDAPSIYATVVADRSPRWRFQKMFDATKLALAAAVVALFGGLLLNGALTGQTDVHPSAEATGVGVAVHGTLDGDPSELTVSDAYEGQAFSAGAYVFDALPVDFDDDRLDGTLSGRVDMAFYFPEIVAMRGTVAITNEDGSWNGTVSGAGLTGNDWHVLMQFDGAGAYEGLSATLMPGTAEADRGTVTGVIYAGADLDPSQRPASTAATE
jgi:hypothetical protein